MTTSHLENLENYRSSPPLFLRRLVLLALAMVLVFGVLTIQLLRLSVVEGRERRTVVEEKLDRRTLLPTRRGTMDDRTGRALAVDRASYDVAVHYALITGSWQIEQATDAAVRAVGRTMWSQMGPEARDAAVQQALGPWEAIADDLWHQIGQLSGLGAGEIARRRDAIRAQVQALAAAVWQRQRASWLDERERRREQAKFAPLDDKGAVFEPQPIREQRQPHVILPRVADEVAYAFQRLALRHPGLIEVQDSRRREYPWLIQQVTLDRSTLPRPLRSEEPLTVTVEGVADHLLGSMREEVWAEDVRRRPFRDPETGRVDLGGYRSGDSVGSTGLEQVYEDHLRGLRGQIVEHLDTGQRERVAPVAGQDLTLTIDVRLQARIQAILSPQLGLTVVQPWHQNHGLPEGEALHGAAVVVDIPTGEILAMVSTPTLALGRHLPESAAPQVNRAAAGQYPPGSLLKPLVLCAAVEQGVHELRDPIECRGHYFEELKTAARCWIYREKYGFDTHGPLLAAEALGRSCNIFFYTLADRLGMESLVQWLRAFGLGAGASILPDARDIEAMRKAGSLRFNTVGMGIGQGRLTWSPLHAADAYAILARGGRVLGPKLVIDDPRGTAPTRPDLDLDATLVDTVLEGLRQSVEERYGTGHRIPYDEGEDEPIINAGGVRVWGKTGTAEAPALVRDLDGDGEIGDGEAIAGLDHSWFVGLVGPVGGRPLMAIAVVVEYGGSGGRVAGPVANQIIHALQDHHYLPEPAP